MVALLHRQPRTRVRPSNASTKPEKPIKAYRETVLLWDRISDQLIKCTLPFSELQSSPINQRSRFTHNVRLLRLYGAGLVAIIFWGLATILADYALPVMAAMGLALFLAAPIGAALGWFLGPLFASKPVWLMLRDWDDYEKPLDDRRAEIIGLEHTLTRGVPQEIWESNVTYALKQFRQQYENGNSDGELPHTGNFGLVSSAGANDGYIPRVNRSAFLYEILQGRNPAAWLKGKVNSTLPMLQIASSTGLMVVIIIAVVLVVALQSGG